MIGNVYQEFVALLPARPLLVGDVIATAAGVATIELPGGGTIQARGAAAVGQRVFVRDGAIEGAASTLSYVSADV